MSKDKHANIPVFIPHLGCPNDCVFCDQRTISGVKEFSPSDVRGIINEALATLESTGRRAEIAFFGGSFTGIQRELMTELLDTAESFVRDGRADGIRMSTRPDYISEEIIDIIGRYTLSEVELGIQSMSDHVLALSRRGHTSADTERAAALLSGAGIPFVGQMMIGLPGATEEDEVHCAREICTLGASGCRIYPTVVFKGTRLEIMAKRGEYTPLELDDAVRRSASVLEVFHSHGVRCLRIGLQDSEMLHDEGRYFAGPAHPAMGELVRGEVFRRRICESIEKLSERDDLTVEIPRGAMSMAVGLSGVNRRYITEHLGVGRIKFKENEALHGFEVNIVKTT